MIALFVANKQPAIVTSMAGVYLNNHYINAQATKKQALVIINPAATARHSRTEKKPF